MKWSQVVALVLASGTALLEPVPASAWTEYLSMDALPEASGWSTTFDGSPGSSSVVNGGILTLTAASYREYLAPPSWVSTVQAAVGYKIEFRMRVLTRRAGCTGNPGIGVWYADNTNITIISIDPEGIYVHYPHGPNAGLGATQWHTYTILVLDSHHQIYVDGTLTLDYQHPATGDASHILMFGDLGGCGYSQSEWDYVAYDTAPGPVSAAPTTWGKLKALYRGAR